MWSFSAQTAYVWMQQALSNRCVTSSALYWYHSCNHRVIGTGGRAVTDRHTNMHIEHAG